MPSNTDVINARKLRACKDFCQKCRNLSQTSFPGDLAHSSTEKWTNQKHSNAQLCADMFHNDS